MTRLVRLTLLTAIWVAAWSDVSIANIATGLVVALVISMVFHTWHDGHVVVRPVRAATFAIVFLVALVRSSITVAAAVLFPRRGVHPGIVAVPLPDCSDAIATLIADAVSLTPGTLSLDISRAPLTLYVHALDTRDPDAVRRDVLALARRAVLAFGDPLASSANAGRPS